MLDRKWWLPVGAGAAYAALASATTGRPNGTERAVARRLNSGGTRPWLRVPQQAGTPWVLPALAVGAWLTRHDRLAVAAALALPAEKALEVGTKKLSRRPRPAVAVDETTLRDDAPVEGPAFPSGHAAIPFCAVTLLAPEVGARLTAVLASVAGLSAYVRVHQGAHYATDALGGALMGIALGSGLRAAVRA